MNQMRTSYIIAFLVLGVAITLFLMDKYIQNPKGEPEEVCFNLPRNSDPMVFGPKYWEAFHALSHRIPCGLCRGFAERFMVFFHDTVNLKLGKPLYDKENFDYFTKLYVDISQGKEVFNTKDAS